MTCWFALLHTLTNQPSAFTHSWLDPDVPLVQSDRTPKNVWHWKQHECGSFIEFFWTIRLRMRLQPGQRVRWVWKLATVLSSEVAEPRRRFLFPMSLLRYCPLAAVSYGLLLFQKGQAGTNKKPSWMSRLANAETSPDIWLVVWNLELVFSIFFWEEYSQLKKSYVSEGLKPPTSYLYRYYRYYNHYYDIIPIIKMIIPL